jgi:hypothetical protein
MEFFIVVALLGIWLYGLKIRNDMHRQSRETAIRTLGMHDPVGLVTIWCRRRPRRDAAPRHSS